MRRIIRSIKADLHVNIFLPIALKKNLSNKLNFASVKQHNVPKSLLTIFTGKKFITFLPENGTVYNLRLHLFKVQRY